MVGDMTLVLREDVGDGDRNLGHSIQRVFQARVLNEITHRVSVSREDVRSKDEV